MQKQDELIQDQQATIQDWDTCLDELYKIKTALEDWENKTVDIRFNKEYFTSTHEWGDSYRHVVNKDESIFPSSEYQMHIHDNEYVELDSRDTKHVLEEVRGAITKYLKYKDAGQERLKEMQDTDAEQIMQEILDVYHKHEPNDTLWKKILDDYAVKYPS